MRHTLRLHGVTVGWSDLEHTEPDLGRATGRFRTGLGWELVEPVFRLFAEAVPLDGGARDEAKLQRYYKARDALQLELLDDTGAVIPTSAIHIADYSREVGKDGRELDVLISDERYWRRRAEEGIPSEP